MSERPGSIMRLAVGTDDISAFYDTTSLASAKFFMSKELCYRISALQQLQSLQIFEAATPSRRDNVRSCLKLRQHNRS